MVTQKPCTRKTPSFSAPMRNQCIAFTIITLRRFPDTSVSFYLFIYFLSQNISYLFIFFANNQFRCRFVLRVLAPGAWAQHSGRIKEERETAVAATLHPTATFARVLRVRFCRTPFAFTYSLTPRATFTLTT